MNPIARAAVVGCGARTAPFIAGMLARLRGAYQVRIHVHSELSAARARRRLDAALAALSADAEVSAVLDWEVVAASPVAAGTDLVLLAMGSDLRSIGGAETYDDLRRFYCARLRSDAIVLVHSAEFPAMPGPLTVRPEYGLFHFLYPGDLVALVEVGMSGFAAQERDNVARFFRSAGLFPLVHEKWLAGFLSNRFQVQLLEAAGRLIGSDLTGHLAKQLDEAIKVVVVQLYRSLRRVPSGSGVFAQVAQHKERYLAQDERYQSLWNVFADICEELRPFWSEREVAAALLTGPALRCIEPGFLRQIDILGIAPFVGLTRCVCPFGSDEIFYRLMSAGRCGTASPYGSGAYACVDGGFYPSGPASEHAARLAKQRTFLRRHRRFP